MKKILLSLGFAALAMSANADKVVIIAADALSAWAETPAEIADADQTIVLPEGYYYISPADREPEVKIVKPLACKYFSIAAIESCMTTDGTETGKINNSYVTSGGLRWYENNWVTVTPAKGVTVKKLTVRSQSSSYCGTISLIDGTTVTSSTVDSSDASNVFQTIDINKSETFNLHAGKQNRIFYMIFETEGTPGNVEMPVFANNFSALVKGQTVELSAPTAGSEIYYTLDGTAPTTSSTKYTAPIALTENAPVRAIAVKDGEQSFEAYQDFMLVNADGTNVATFDFSDFTTLYSVADATTIPLSQLAVGTKNANIAIGETVFSDNGVTFVDSSAKIFRSWTFGNVVELRPDNGATMTLTAPEGKYISDIYIQGSKITGQAYSGDNGAITACKYNTSKAMWAAADGQKPTEVVITSSIADEYLDQLYVYLMPDDSSVATIEADENAPVEYYNLQGIRVANPENGLYIVKQGNKISKRIIK